MKIFSQFPKRPDRRMIRFNFASYTVEHAVSVSTSS